MCGILGVVALWGKEPSITDPQATAMRDTMLHRGPDGAGLLRVQNAVFGHRRLAIRDQGSGGQQPARTSDGRYVLVYNGELYNDGELRERLREQGVELRSACDTETVLQTLATFGVEALSSLRGMFALGFFDTHAGRLVLARDPLGIKPLYYHAGPSELSFASEPPALLAHPGIEAEPDMAMVSAYLSTVRTVLGERTMFRGISALPPGRVLTWDTRSGKTAVERIAQGTQAFAVSSGADRFVSTLEETVQSHLVSDVPVAAFLSGGIDSSVICEIVQGLRGDLSTFCAQAGLGEEVSEDASMARLVAGRLRTNHLTVRVDGESFGDGWKEMVMRLGVPLSTPNEVALYALSRWVRAAGFPVVLSGEGADEVLGGYELSLQAASDYLQEGGNPLEGGAYQLGAAAWVAPVFKERLLTSKAWDQAGGDGFLLAHYGSAFAECVGEVGPDADPLEAHLRFLRHQNLPGLLQRLDSASMLASVEGRTPFADGRFAAFAEALSMGEKFVPEAPGGGLATAVSGKLALRRAWRGRLPVEVETRPKHSFPVPFQEWMGPAAKGLLQTDFARGIFREDLATEVAQNPAEHWRFAWPMFNLALWGQSLWG